MTIGIIVQARMTSARLPGKVLRQVSGKPLLQYLTERLSRCATVTEIVVATSTDEADEPIESYCRNTGLSCHRGPLQNVAARYLEVITHWRFDAFVRVSGDSPLIDPALVDEGVRRFTAGDYDLVSNVGVRSYPTGQSVEVIGAEVYRAAFEHMSTAEHFEHVTPYLYEHASNVRRVNFALTLPRTDVRMAVDTADDLRVVTEMVSRMTRPHWEYALPDLLTLYDQVMRWPSNASASA